MEGLFYHPAIGVTSILHFPIILYYLRQTLSNEWIQKHTNRGCATSPLPLCKIEATIEESIITNNSTHLTACSSPCRHE